MSLLLSLLVSVFAGGTVLFGILWATPRYRLMQSHWITFTFLVPFLALLWIHHMLDLSDALMVATPPGEREAHAFNFVLVVVFSQAVLASWHTRFICLTKAVCGSSPSC